MNLFGANTPVIDEFFTIPEFPAFDYIRDIARNEPGVSQITSQVSTKAFLDAYDTRTAALLCGVDAATYFDMFPGIMLEAGRFLDPGEYGAMITVERAKRIADHAGIYPEMGAPLLLTAGGAMGFKIREVPLVGIFRYANPGPLMNEIVITDPQTARILASIQVASADMPEEDGSIDFLDAPIDDLFGESTFFGSDISEDTGDITGDAFSPDSITAYLSDLSNDEQAPLVGGDWNFIILRLKHGVRPGQVIASLNKKINPMGTTAVSWRIAAGNSAILLLLVQSLFNGGIFLMSTAGIIAAVNILLISVFKRNREIGTLRAIGAGDGYIRSLVLGENLILACIAGGLGILAGFWFIHAVNNAAIVIPNDLISSLLGGSVLTLHFIPPVAGISFGVAVFLGLAASVFPVETAVRIDPIVAVTQG
jgi:putative ABC transport system permease protein